MAGGLGEELYDMEKDPDQLTNVAADPAYTGVKQRLAKQLETFLKQHDDPRMRGETPWDSYPFTTTIVLENPNWRIEGMPSALPQ